MRNLILACVMCLVGCVSGETEDPVVGDDVVVEADLGPVAPDLYKAHGHLVCPQVPITLVAWEKCDVGDGPGIQHVERSCAIVYNCRGTETYCSQCRSSITGCYVTDRGPCEISGTLP